MQRLRNLFKISEPVNSQTGMSTQNCPVTKPVTHSKGSVEILQDQMKNTNSCQIRAKYCNSYKRVEIN
jgi:hypothetical protein